MQELKEYSTQSNKNFDRVRTFGWLLMYEEETVNLDIEQAENDDVADMLVNTGKIFKPSRRDVIAYS